MIFLCFTNYSKQYDDINSYVDSVVCLMTTSK